MYAFPTPDELMELVTHMIADGRGEYICSNITYIQEEWISYPLLWNAVTPVNHTLSMPFVNFMG